MDALAMPRKSRKPNTSAAVVTNTDDATASSWLTLRGHYGTAAPTVPL